MRKEPGPVRSLKLSARQGRDVRDRPGQDSFAMDSLDQVVQRTSNQRVGIEQEDDIGSVWMLEPEIDLRRGGPRRRIRRRVPSGARFRWRPARASDRPAAGRRDPRPRSQSPANPDTPLRIVGASGSSNGADTGTRASGTSARGLPASADPGAGPAAGIDLMRRVGSYNRPRLGSPGVFGHRVAEAGPAESKIAAINVRYTILPGTGDLTRFTRPGSRTTAIDHS